MKHRFLTLLFALAVSIGAGFAGSFYGFEVNNGNLGTQIKENGLIYDTINTTLVESDGPKYSINLVAAGEGTFKMGGITFYYNGKAGNTAFKTYGTYIQPNGKDREIRIPTVDGEIVIVRLTEACAGVLVNGVSTDLAEGDNKLIATGDSIVLKTASTKPKISAILSTGMLTNYTVFFYPPYLCEGVVPAVTGDFNNWTALPMHDTVYYGDSVYTVSFKAEQNSVINFCDTAMNKLMRKSYGDWYEYYAQTLYSWYTTLEINCSDQSSYRFANCTPPPMHAATATVLVPTDCNMPLTDGLYICWWSESDSENKHAQKMTDKGNRIYAITFDPNDYLYSYYFMNGTNDQATGYKRTYESVSLSDDSICWEVGYNSMNESWNQHGLNRVDDCVLKDHNYMPYNLQATNTGLDTMVFSWDEAEEVYGYVFRCYNEEGDQVIYQYLSVSSVPDKKYTWAFKNAEPAHMSYWTIEARNQNYDYYPAKGNSFTVAGDGRIPHNLTVEDKGNNVYTLRWESTGDVHLFNVTDGWNSYDTTALQYDLTLEPNSYYTLTVSAMTANDDVIGAADYGLSTYAQAARDITVYFYLPRLEKFNTGKGYAMIWRDSELFGDHIVPLVAMDGGGHRFKAVVPQYTRDAIRIQLVNDSTGVAPTETINYEYQIQNDQYYTITRDDKDKATLSNYMAQSLFEEGRDVAITSLQATQNLNKMVFSWTSNDKAPYYRVRIYNEDGSTYWDRSVQDTFVTYEINNADTLRMAWGVTPSQSYWSEYYGLTAKSTFTAAPSPFLPTNLKAVNNNDGTFTFSWSPAEHDTVTMYNLNIYSESGDYIAGKGDMRATSVTMPVQLLFSGKYVMQVTSMTSRYYTMGEKTDTFVVAPTTPHTIAIRVMMNPTANYDTSEGLKFRLNYKMDSTKLVDAVKEKYGWWSYNLTTDQYGVQLSLQNSWSEVRIYGDTCLEYTGGFQEVDCDARSTDYIPHHLQAIPNGDGTYLLSWMIDRTEKVREYRIDIQHQDSNWYDSKSTQTLQCKTPLLPYSGKYIYTVRVNDNNWNTIGTATDTIVVAPQAERTLTLRVLEQRIEQGWTGYRLDAYYNENALDIQDELENEKYTGWCYAKVTTTDPAVHIRLRSAWGEETDFWMAADTCIKVHNGFIPVACDAKMPTYTISNPHIESLGNGRVTFTWECTEDPDQFYIQTQKPGNTPFTYNYVDGAARQLTTSLNVDTTTEISWYILALMNRNGNTYNIGGITCDTAAIEPSKYAPQNLQATANRDGSYTVSWNSLPDTVAYYEVQIAYPGRSERDYFQTTDTSFVTPVLKDLGRHFFYVYSVDKKNNGLGWQSIPVVVDTLDTPRDITVRVLIHPDTERDNPGYLQVYRIYHDPEYGAYADWEALPYTSQGNNWYSYTFSSVFPVQHLYLLGSHQYVAYDTCFEYSSSGLKVAACDAVAHDYRIVDGSLKAVSEAGKVTFSWSGKEKADEYQIQGYYDAPNGYWYSAFYTTVTDTSYVYMVPDDMDSITLMWQVTPVSPHRLNSVNGPDVLLHKSEILITDMKVTTTDSVTFHFTWKCNTDTVQYEVRVNQMNSRYWPVADKQVDTTMFDYTCLTADIYYGWEVRAVTAQGEPLSAWVNDTMVIQAKPGLKAITNLQGSAQENVLTFTWDPTIPAVSARLYYIDAEMGWSDVFGTDTLIVGNTFTYATTKDGRYEFSVQPYVDVNGEYLPLQEHTWVQTNVFTTPTFKVTILASEGGRIWDNPSGNYPKDYEIWINADEEVNYRFVQWSDGVKEMNRSLKVTSDTTITAYFEIRKIHNLTLNATAGGTLAWWDNEGHEHHGTSYQGTLAEGINFWVDAEPNDEYTFYTWSDGNKEQNRGISIHSDSTITAVFKPICYATITAGEGGRIQVTGGEYNKTTKKYRCTYGTELTLKADPDEDYRFTGWSDGGTGVMRTVVITSDTTIQALFAESTTPLQQYVVRILSDNTDLGTVNNVSGTYYGGDQLTITATPTERAEFVQWSDGVKDATRVITVSQDTTLIASFIYKKITLTLHASEGGTVNDSTANGTYDYGTLVQIVATPNEHYRFVQWSDGSTNAVRTITMTDKVELTATFAPELYTVLFLNDDGTILSADEWNYGQTPTCSKTPTKAATAEFTYTFKGWSPTIVPVTDNATYTATYDSIRNKYTITWNNSDGSTIDQTSVEYGQTPSHADPTKAATAEFTYTFAGWTPTIAAVTGDATYTATYDSIRNKYTITFKDDDGTVLSAEEWEYGQTPTCANPTKPDDDQYTYTFAGWDPAVATVTGEATYVATYTKKDKHEGLEEIMGDGTSRKVLIDGHVYILRGGRIYTAQGQLVQ